MLYTSPHGFCIVGHDYPIGTRDQKFQVITPMPVPHPPAISLNGLTEYRFPLYNYHNLGDFFRRWGCSESRTTLLRTPHGCDHPAAQAVGYALMSHDTFTELTGAADVRRAYGTGETPQDVRQILEEGLDRLIQESGRDG
jgi:hypothetical protein